MRNNSIKTFIKLIYSISFAPFALQFSVSVTIDSLDSFSFFFCSFHVCTPSNQRLKILKIQLKMKMYTFRLPLDSVCVLYLIASLVHLSFIDNQVATAHSFIVYFVY